jgi:mannose-6-phosphate isomerase-like protein (cupin superfamily)
MSAGALFSSLVVRLISVPEPGSDILPERCHRQEEREQQEGDQYLNEVEIDRIASDEPASDDSRQRHDDANDPAEHVKLLSQANMLETADMVNLHREGAGFDRRLRTLSIIPGGQVSSVVIKCLSKDHAIGFTSRFGGMVIPRSCQEDLMKGFVDDIEGLTEDNSDFRRVLYTATEMQLVLMALQPGQEIGEEVHKDRTQFFRVEKGNGEVWIDGASTKIKGDTAIIVPAGARHNIRNTGKKPLKMYTLYAPPEHADGTVHVTKADAEASEEHFDGKTSE